LLILLPFFVSADVVEFNKCIDGDTFKVVLNDEVVTVRLLAVDTPESVHPDKEKEYYGDE
jgi:micrococcal nuclease